MRPVCVVRSEADEHRDAAPGINADGSGEAASRIDDTLTASSPCFPQQCLTGAVTVMTPWSRPAGCVVFERTRRW